MSDFSEQEVEQMVENIDRTGEANPQEEKPQNEQPAQIVFDNPDALMAHKLEYTANGKQVSEDIATILKRASQGYNYAQLANGLKTREAEIAELENQAKQTNEKWSKFENYAKENPAWYDHWTRAWENRGNAQAAHTPDGESSEFDSRITALLDQRLGPITEFMNSQQAVMEQADASNQDKALDADIKATRDQFSTIDFDKSDPDTGKTLEYQVLEFAHQKGYNSFSDAFKVFYHDKLMAHQLENEKAKWAKEQADKQRKGIIGESKVPTTPTGQPDLKNSSWDQIANFAAKSMGLES